MGERVSRLLRNLISRRRAAYRAVFGTPAGERTLADLALFCRAHASTYRADPREHALLEGRREVFLRIREHLDLTDDELFDLVRRNAPTEEG